LPRNERYEPIDGEALYRKLAMGEPVVVLDVRTETEYARMHIPGSLLIPLHELEGRIVEVPNSGIPVAVVCEYGVRSVAACRRLAEHGHRDLFNVTGGLDAWPGPITSGAAASGPHRHGIAPSSFLVENFDLLPRGLALDLGMGEGRNAIYLATRGFDVDGVDRSPQAVARARAAARQVGAPIRAVVGDPEDGTYIIPIETYDVIVVFNYLHRPLFNDIREGLRPAGVVVYQTFTLEQSEHSPGDPDYERLLRPGELKQVFQDWTILRYREAVGPSRRESSVRAVAGIIARKPD